MTDKNIINKQKQKLPNEKNEPPPPPKKITFENIKIWRTKKK